MPQASYHTSGTSRASQGASQLLVPDVTPELANDDVHHAIQPDHFLAAIGVNIVVDWPLPVPVPNPPVKCQLELPVTTTRFAGYGCITSSSESVVTRLVVEADTRCAACASLAR